MRPILHPAGFFSGKTWILHYNGCNWSVHAHGNRSRARLRFGRTLLHRRRPVHFPRQRRSSSPTIPRTTASQQEAQLPSQPSCPCGESAKWNSEKIIHVLYCSQQQQTGHGKLSDQQNHTSTNGVNFEKNAVGQFLRSAKRLERLPQWRKYGMTAT